MSKRAKFETKQAAAEAPAAPVGMSSGPLKSKHPLQMSKRAKFEIKQAADAAAPGAGNATFNIPHLLVYLFSFLPNSQLPKIKRANKSTKAAFLTNKALEERRQRGVVAQYARLDWIRDRANFFQENITDYDDAEAFTVCCDCKGFVAGLGGPNTNTAEYLHVTSVKEMQCWPCAHLAAMLVNAVNKKIEDVEMAHKRYLVEFNLGFVPSADDRRLVEKEERHEPDEHLARLQRQFPYTPPTESDREGEEDIVDFDALDDAVDSEEEAEAEEIEL